MKAASRKNQGRKAKQETAYVTKRVLVRAASPAFRKASSEAMAIKCYVIKAENGWVIREDKDGTKTKISQIEPVKRPAKIVLD